MKTWRGRPATDSSGSDNLLAGVWALVSCKYSLFGVRHSSERDASGKVKNGAEVLPTLSLRQFCLTVRQNATSGSAGVRAFRESLRPDGQVRPPPPGGFYRPYSHRSPIAKNDEEG